MSGVYATQADVTKIKTAFNSFVKAVQSEFTSIHSTLELYKKSINGIVGAMKQMDAVVKELNTSNSSSDIVSKLNSAISQLNATVDYMATWADTGNLTMKDVRESVGSRLSLAEE